MIVLRSYDDSYLLWLQQFYKRTLFCC